MNMEQLPILSASGRRAWLQILADHHPRAGAPTQAAVDVDVDAPTQAAVDVDVDAPTQAAGASAPGSVEPKALKPPAGGGAA